MNKIIPEEKYDPFALFDNADSDPFAVQSKHEIHEDQIKPIKQTKKGGGRGERFISYERKTQNIYRRAYSELKLLEGLPKELKEGYSYHCITGGDIDSLSYIKHILKLQPLKYLLFSTWCLGDDDLLQFEEWINAGLIGRLDCYVGEIFPSTYAKHYARLCQLIREKGNGGRVAVFKNHSKIFAGYGDKFHFGIESSANINTNPRTENGCITIGEDIYTFFKSYFDEIKSFNEWGEWVKHG